MSKMINDTKSKGLAFYYDEELFNDAWASEVDPTSLVLLESGVVVNDPIIESLISSGSNYYTIPFYKDLEGDPQKYDGMTDIVGEYTDSGKQSGVVYGQAKEFMDKIFVRDFTTANPMANIVARIGRYWAKIDQKAVINVLEGIFGITSDTEWNKHTTNIASKTTTVGDTNKIGLTTLRDTAVKALGENADSLSFAIMHSNVANTLSNLQVLNFFKYESNGMSYDVRVARSGNMLVLVSDQVPVKDSATATGEKEYTTYLCGAGAILTAPAPVEKPSDYVYDPETAGGIEKLITRRRKTYHPNGFTFTYHEAKTTGEGDSATTTYEVKPLPTSIKPSDLAVSANWNLELNANNIRLARLITNG